MRTQLELATLGVSDSVLYEELVELTIRVSDHILASYEVLRKKVRGAMGGEVLELMRNRAERLEREAREQGIEQGVEQMAASLRASGVDEDAIQAAIAAARQSLV